MPARISPTARPHRHDGAAMVLERRPPTPTVGRGVAYPDPTYLSRASSNFSSTISTSILRMPSGRYSMLMG